MSTWHDGSVYCDTCLQCPHVAMGHAVPAEFYGGSPDEVCLICLKQLFSIATFEGWRLVNITLYALEAWGAYGVVPKDLDTWTWEESALLLEISNHISRPGTHGDGWRVNQPPPHLREPMVPAPGLPPASDTRAGADD